MSAVDVGNPHTTVKYLGGRQSLAVFTNGYADAVSEMPRYAGFGYHWKMFESGRDPAYVSFWCPEARVGDGAVLLRTLVLDESLRELHHRDKGCELLLGWIIAFDAHGEAPAFDVISSAPAGFLHAALDAARALDPEIDIPSWFPELPSVHAVPASHDIRG